MIVTSSKLSFSIGDCHIPQIVLFYWWWPPLPNPHILLLIIVSSRSFFLLVVIASSKLSFSIDDHRLRLIVSLKCWSTPPFNHYLLPIIFMLLIALLCYWSSSCSSYIIVLLFLFAYCLVLVIFFFLILKPPHFPPSSLSQGSMVCCNLVEHGPWITITLALIIFWTFDVNLRLTPLNLTMWAIKPVAKYMDFIPHLSYCSCKPSCVNNNFNTFFFSLSWIFLSTIMNELAIPLAFFYFFSFHLCFLDYFYCLLGVGMVK